MSTCIKNFEQEYSSRIFMSSFSFVNSKFFNLFKKAKASQGSRYCFDSR
ncbi:hypothetical protein CpecA_0860 [Chlamydia pecorum IPTaLE]|nr:hypothetical protein CpecA_0860 [Chlamydia pecorum IPTaLE]